MHKKTQNQKTMIVCNNSVLHNHCIVEKTREKTKMEMYALIMHYINIQ